MQKQIELSTLLEFLLKWADNVDSLREMSGAKRFKRKERQLLFVAATLLDLLIRVLLEFLTQEAAQGSPESLQHLPERDKARWFSCPDALANLVLSLDPPPLAASKSRKSDDMRAAQH